MFTNVTDLNCCTECDNHFTTLFFILNEVVNQQKDDVVRINKITFVVVKPEPVGITIGGGIFRTPAGIADRVPDPVWMLGVWVLGGLIVLCGALSFGAAYVQEPVREMRKNTALHRKARVRLRPTTTE